MLREKTFQSCHNGIRKQRFHISILMYSAFILAFTATAWRNINLIISNIVQIIFKHYLEYIGNYSKKYLKFMCQQDHQ